MPISGSCLPEPVKCPSKPLIAFPHRPCGPIYQLFRWHLSLQCQWGDNYSYYQWHEFCNLKSFPLITPRNPIWWLISKPYLQSEIAIGILIYQGHNSQNQPILIVYVSRTIRQRVSFGNIFLCNANSQWCLDNTPSKPDWLFNTQSRILQAELLILENSEKATLSMLYSAI